MRRTAGIVLAASLMIPLLAARAESPEPAPTEHAVLVTTSELVSLPESEQPLEVINLAPGVETLAPEDSHVPEKLRWQVLEQRRRASSRFPGGPCLAAGDQGDDFCAAAARISHSRPWQQVMGIPGLRPAPRSMVWAADPLPETPETPEKD